MFHTTFIYTYPEVGTSGFAILTFEMVLWEIRSLVLLCPNAISLYHTVLSLPVTLQGCLLVTHTHTQSYILNLVITNVTV